MLSAEQHRLPAKTVYGSVSGEPSGNSKGYQKRLILKAFESFKVLIE
jgi:hypothetical protein